MAGKSDLGETVRTHRRRATWVAIAAASALVLASATSAFATTATFGPTGIQPYALAIDDDGDLYVTSFSDSNVTKILADGTVVGSPWPVTVGANPNEIVVDTAGYAYVANAGSNTVSRISPDGVASGSAGDNYRWVDTEGYPFALALDRQENLYVANYFSASVTKITPAGVSELAWGQTGTNPRDIAFDPYGNLYTPNVFTANVSKISPSGAAGDAPWPVTTANSPQAATVDWEGNVYVAYLGPPSGVAKITPSGTTVGSPWPASVGTSPTSITIDSKGNLYATDYPSSIVTKIAPDGSSSLLASTGGGPSGITIDSEGNLYTANAATNNVTKISPGGGTADIAPAPPAPPATPTASPGAGSATVTVAPNPESARYGAPSAYLVGVVQDGSKTCTITPPATSCKITGLTPGNNYLFAARSKLNAWVTQSSEASNEVKPRAHTVTVGALKAKVSKKSVSLSSKVTVSGAGKIDQTAKAGKKTWCKASKTISAAGAHTLDCELGKKARRAIRRKSLKLSVKTTFTPTAGSAVSKTSKVTIKRKR